MGKTRRREGSGGERKDGCVITWRLTEEKLRTPSGFSPFQIVIAVRARRRVSILSVRGLEDGKEGGGGKKSVTSRPGHHPLRVE